MVALRPPSLPPSLSLLLFLFFVAVLVSSPALILALIIVLVPVPVLILVLLVVLFWSGCLSPTTARGRLHAVRSDPLGHGDGARVSTRTVGRLPHAVQRRPARHPRAAVSIRNRQGKKRMLR